MKRLDEELARAERFEEATAIVCETAQRIGIATCAVVLHRIEEKPGELAIPVIGRQGWFATIVCAGAGPEHQRDLAMAAMYLSVWCTQKGIGASNDTLTKRQFEIAELAAAGLTNGEIADELGISINTVKARLKEVFERLGVGNRTELSNVMQRVARVSDPLPVTR